MMNAMAMTTENLTDAEQTAIGIWSVAEGTVQNLPIAWRPEAWLIASHKLDGAADYAHYAMHYAAAREFRFLSAIAFERYAERIV